MLSNLIHLQYCYDYLVNQIPIGLLLYSHIPGAVIALLFGGFLLFNSRKLANVTLFIVCLFFAVWCLFDLGSWFAFLGSENMMFTWASTDLVGLLFFVFSYYFLYTFLTGKDLPGWQKLVGVVLTLPTAAGLFLGEILTTYDANTCEAFGNDSYGTYLYFAEGFVVLAVIILAVVLFRRAKDLMLKKEIILATTGVLAFLGFFLSSQLGVNYLETDTAVQFAYNFEIYGLFGMPILLAYLGYLIVRYQAFNLKIFGAQALIVALVALIGSEFAFVTSTSNQILVAVTLMVTGIIGIQLIRSVRREVEQRELLEKLTVELELTNERQEGLIHYIGHEVKGFLTKDEAAFAALSDGDFGTLTDGIKDFVVRALAQARDGVRSVTEILMASNQKKGTISYTKASFDLKAAIAEVIEKERSTASQKGLSISFLVDDPSTPAMFNGDREKVVDNILRNLIENAINYTPTGSITVTFKKGGGKYILTVKDTGIGINPEDKKMLFIEGGHGKESQKVNAHSTGYGLFIAKNVVEGHGGTIRAESEGQGKGSTFTVELPAT